MSYDRRAATWRAVPLEGSVIHQHEIDHALRRDPVAAKLLEENGDPDSQFEKPTRPGEVAAFFVKVGDNVGIIGGVYVAYDTHSEHTSKLSFVIKYRIIF